MTTPLEAVSDTLIKLNEKKAVDSLLNVFGKHAVTIEEMDLIARLMYKHKRYSGALEFSGRVAEMTGHKNKSALINYANALSHANEPQKALSIIEQLQNDEPASLELMLMRAYALYLLGRRHEAESILRHAYNHPDATEKTKLEIDFNLGTYELYKGNFREGLSRFLNHGRAMNLWRGNKLPGIEWDGHIDSKTKIVVVAEGGIGDEFINIRFAVRLAKITNVVWVSDRKDLVDFFNEQYSFGSDLMFHATTQLPAQSEDLRWCFSMDLPLKMNLTQDELWDGPYIKNKHGKIKTNEMAINIGVRWQGNPDYDDDLHRSVPLRDIVVYARQLYPRAELVFHCLQRDTGLDEFTPELFAQFPKTSGVMVKTDSWWDTAKAIDSMDCVISSCTSVAHLAAAMGKDTRVFVPLSAYYPWCTNFQRSPWYGIRVTLVRQKVPGSWSL